MTNKRPSLASSAYRAFTEKNADEKVRLTHKCYDDWKNKKLDFLFDEDVPSRPGRPDKPELLSPKDMPRRRNAKARAARIAMLHAIAHIELNAIDLALDIILRFGRSMPRNFSDDWLRVASDEARHFVLLNDRLAEFDSYYGALPAHDGLWQSAERTANDLLARLAVVPMVLEARGLDVTPALIKKFELADDFKSVNALEVIYREEIDHVKAGHKWFNFICSQHKYNPEETYQKLVTKYFAGNLKPPFNVEARDSAGLIEQYYMPIAYN